MLSSSFNENEVPQKKDSPNGRNEIVQKENFHNRRLIALELVQSQKANGLSLKEYFKKQKEDNVIGISSWWIVLNENDRYFVIYRRDFSHLDSPMSDQYAQWVVIPQNDSMLLSDAKIYALNGTAKSFTPELGEVAIQDSGKSKALTFYLRWEELMEKSNWDENKYQTNLDKVAQEFKVSTEEADILYGQGEKERDTQGKSQMESRGEVLSVEKMTKLLEENGDIYME